MLQLLKPELVNSWRSFFWEKNDSFKESLGEGGSSTYEEKRERDLEERGHATPRATTVPAFPLELLTSAFL